MCYHESAIEWEALAEEIEEGEEETTDQEPIDGEPELEEAVPTPSDD